MAKAPHSDVIIVPEMKRVTTRLRIIGTSPMFMNRMSAKAKQTLFLGGKKKTAAEKAQIKHDPLKEYRDAAQMVPTGPTALGLKVVAVKAAMAEASLETVGVKKASVQRLLFMPGEFSALYGTPKLRLDVVRSQDVNRTPDIRSRPFIEKWGAEIEVQYIIPQLDMTSIITLLANAGQIIGVGDFRQSKGKGGFGLFRVIGQDDDDPDWADLVKNHGREAQLKALQHPEFANDETVELMDCFFSEKSKRGE